MVKVREKILSTASDLFHNHGYNSTGINQIIAEAGIAKGSFYYNFKSKEDLCVSFLDSRHEFWFDQLRNFINQDKSGQKPILSTFDFLLMMNSKENFRGCSFLNILSEIPGDNKKLLQVIQGHKNDLRNYIGQLSGEADGDHIYLLFESAIIESQLFKNQWSIEKAKKIVQKIIN